MSALDSLIAFVSPAWAAKRAQARVTIERSKHLERGFKATAKGRRSGEEWNRLGEGRPTESTADLATLRHRAREMDRNNPYWVAAKNAIVEQVVGHGIRATVSASNKKVIKRVQDAWDVWACSSQADAAGMLDFYGLQAIVMGTVAEDGEILAVQRLGDNGRLKIQLLGPEYLDDSKDQQLSDGGEIVGGVEVDKFGARVAYHIRNRHPSRSDGNDTVRIEAKRVAHVYKIKRANQLRGESWIAPVFTRLRDWDEYEDADLMRQKVAACFGVVYTGVNQDSSEDYEPLDHIEPGMVEFLPNGTTMQTIAPPASEGMATAAVITHRAIAVGLGITYESLTGDYSQVNFASGRLAHLQMMRNVRSWQQRVMIDLFCDRVWGWFLESLSLTEDSAPVRDVAVEWVPPQSTQIDPDKETTADIKRARGGLVAWSELIRESGRDPRRVAQQLAADFALFDELGLVLDIDPRKVSAQGQGTVNQKQEKQEDKGDGEASDDKQAA